MITPDARISGLLAATLNATTSDAELLTRYVAHRDGPAFAALVSRHGSMVFGVCRRVIRDWQIAEDAFQATFLVLARRAATISPPDAVAGWLHGVALRVAQAVRRGELRRMRRERVTAALPDSAEPPAPDTDLRAVIDAELRKLPGKYRELLIACDLEERPRRSVAAALGIPEGTLSSRLTAARRMLSGRLAKRGVTRLSAALVALSGPRLGACEVPRRILASAAKLGCAAAGTVPTAVASLATKASPTVTHRLMIPVSLLALIVCGAVGATLPAGAPPAPRPAVVADGTAAVRRAKPPKADPKPAPKGPNRLLVQRAEQLVLLDPDGKNERTVTFDTGKFMLNGPCALSPDGTHIAILLGLFNDEGRWRLYVRKPGEKGDGTYLEVGCESIHWSPDGTQLVCQGFPDESPGKWLLNVPEETFLVDIGTKKRTPLKFPKGHLITDWSRDGRYFLTMKIDKDIDRPNSRIYLVNRDGTEHKAVTDGKQFALEGALSPDGKQVLYAEIQIKDEKPQPVQKLFLIETATGKSAPVEDVPLNGSVLSHCWSPDGKRIAYIWRQVLEGDPDEIREKEAEAHLVVCDPNGKNLKTVLSEKGKGPNHTRLINLSWR